jgi:hypothetical protein
VSLRKNKQEKPPREENELSTWYFVLSRLF